ncbi:hypothetical protein [Fundidesulfovibrio agrisoli]|uniref:hypothetical protein n=1 Tax=Fundidesulfovibrio agrisoli TaxID=2922717 RepID=UPI001FAC9716|nr:hypothetical protein [Fundidesulfovibrio agrisoli]
MIRPASFPGRALLLAALCLAALGGCAPKPTATGPGEGPQPQALWSQLMAGGSQAKSFTLSASLSLQSPKKSARLLARFWGNLDRPLRLDLSTGMGQVFSMWREDAQGWLAVYPGANQAFTHSSTKAALSRLGMPFPFGMKELAAVSVGSFGLILPASYSSVKKISNGFLYSFPASSPVAALTLDFEGKPIHLTGRGVEPWNVDLSDFAPPQAGRPPMAQLITLTTPGGVQAILRVKKLELGTEPMPLQSLELALPPQARHIPLDREGDFQTPDIP